MDYELVDDGETLLIDIGLSEAELPRLSGSTDEIFGDWDNGFFEEAGPPSFTLQGTFRIEDGRVTSIARCESLGRTITATASSPATITDTTIEILEFAEDERQLEIEQ